MPEALARKIDELSRGLPRDFTYRRLARKSDEFTLDAGERTDVSFITTDAVDRDGEVVIPAGGDWSSYNRVVTFSHRYDQFPVGSNWWIRAKGNGLIAKTHYPQKPSDWGDTPWLPSRDSALDAATRADVHREEHRLPAPELRGVRIIDRWLGVEYAVAPVPCNPEAEMHAVAKGLESGVIDERVVRLISESAEMLDGRQRRSDAMLGPVLRRQILRQIRKQFDELTGKVS